MGTEDEGTEGAGAEGAAPPVPPGTGLTPGAGLPLGSSGAMTGGIRGGGGSSSMGCTTGTSLAAGSPGKKLRMRTKTMAPTATAAEMATTIIVERCERIACRAEALSAGRAEETLAAAAEAAEAADDAAGDDAPGEAAGRRTGAEAAPAGWRA